MLHQRMHTDNYIWLVFLKGTSKSSADDGSVALIVVHEANIRRARKPKLELDEQSQSLPTVKSASCNISGSEHLKLKRQSHGFFTRKK